MKKILAMLMAAFMLTGCLYEPGYNYRGGERRDHWENRDRGEHQRHEDRGEHQRHEDRGERGDRGNWGR